VFYSTLARLLFMEDTPHRFKAFVEPLTQVLNGIAAAAAANPAVRAGEEKTPAPLLAAAARGASFR
jgi:exportin-7